MTPAMLLAALLAGAADPPAPPPVTDDARWLAKPTAEQVLRETPPAAMARGVSGAVLLQCVANERDRLEQCHVLFESPEGLGFGAAALRLSNVFRIAPHAAVSASRSATVKVPIEWRLGGKMYASEAFLVAEPRWSSAPSFADVEAAYLASADGAIGTIALRCRVNNAGHIGLCFNRDLTTRDGATKSPVWRLTKVADDLTDKFQMILNATGLPAGAGLQTDVTFHFVDPKDPEFVGRQIGAPTWVATIAPGDIEKVFPPEAAAKGVTTGRGVAECTVGADGSMQACHPLAGDPGGVGFSEAAVKVASVMRMSLWTNSGGPVVGATVRLPIRFNLAANAAGAPSKP